MKTDSILAALQAVLILAIGFLVGLAVADVSATETWAYAYQTLIAGVFAVAAAWFTVLKMQAVDDRQQDRHTELVRMALRTDRLRALRASYQADFIADILADAPDTDPEDGLSQSDIRTANEALARTLEAWEHFFRDAAFHPTVEKAYDLFEPHMASLYDGLKQSFEDDFAAAKLRLRAASGDNSARRAAGFTLGEIVDMGSYFVDELRSLEKSYR